MKYVIKNLIDFFKMERMIFMLIILCVFSSSIVLHFSYGLYQNFHVIRTEEESDTKEFIIEILEPEYVTKEKLQSCLLSFSNNVNDAVSMYMLYPVIEPFQTKSEEGWGDLKVRFMIDNQTIMPCRTFQQNLESYGTLVAGNYFSEKQENTGSLVAIVGDDIGTVNSCTDAITIINNETGFKVLIQNKEYQVIGVHQMGNTPLIPFLSLNNDTQFKHMVYIELERSLTRSQYEEIQTAFTTIFQDAICVPKLNIPEQENLYFYNTILVIAVAISILAAANYSILYQYILDKRWKNIVIFRICGCHKFQAIRIFLTECLLIMLPTYLISALLYAKVLLPQFREMFPYMEAAYNFKVYLVIFAIYFITSMIVLLCLISYQLSGKKLADSRGRHVR